MEKVVIINASPRKKGYSAKMVDYISNKLEEKEITYKVYNIYDMNIDYCNHCGYCKHVKGCRIKDDMTDLISHIINSSSTIVISPTAFDGPMAKFKTLVDRTNCIYHSKYTLHDSMIDRSKNRIGLLIQIGGASNYPTQFLGGDTICGFFFKCINTKLKHKIYITNIDKEDPLETKIEMIDKEIDLYLNDLI